MSKSSYGTTVPKHSASTRNASKDTEQHAESHETVEPACRSRAVGHSVGSREWREIAYNERRVTSYRPCAWPECFPGGSPDPSEIETVVRSAHQPTVYHRPRKANSSRSGRNGQNSPKADKTGDDENENSDVIASVAELRKGERVVWDGQQTAMLVVEPTTDPSGVVGVVGPNGGEYHIEGRPNYPRSYYISPGYAYQSDLRRVVSENTNPRLETI